jgi:hypothetical protein
MTVVLIGLTIVSLAAAAGFGLLAWRLLADQRRRSDARVAALAAAIHAEPSTVRADARPVAVASMFETAAGAALKGRPLLKGAVVATLAVALIIVAAMSTGDPAPRTAPPPEGAPLELISMRHDRNRQALTVTGVVRNPRAGAPLPRVTATVFAFERDGSFVASGRSPLDFTTLEPGEESPFVVPVALSESTNVARYRVSFRTEVGTLRHVDRRGDTQFARAP